MFGMNKGATGGAPMSSPRPMPNPQTSGIMPTQAPQAGGGMFPGLTPQKRYDMAMQFLQSGMSSAAGSGSPLLAFLSPLAGAAIGGSLQSKLGTATDASSDEMNKVLLGTMAGDPRAQELIGIMGNADAPDYARAMAKDQLAKMMAPPKVAKGGRGGSSARSGRPPSNTDALLSSMFYKAMDPGSDGGETVTPAEMANMEAVKGLRTRTSNVGYNYGGDESDTADDDPLGIR